MTVTTEKPDTQAGRRAGAAVYYDPLSFTSYDHPYGTYQQLRDEAPVYYNERRDLWVISRYADVQQCLRDHERLVNKFGNDIDGTHDTYGVGMLVCQDPPHHTVLRDAIRRCFGGREIMAMEAGMRETARRLVDDFKRSGSGDVIESIALPLAFDVALRLVGVPTSDAPFFTGHLLRAMERTVGKLGVPGDAAVANAESEERIAEVVQARREAIAAGADPDTPDAISQILLAVQDGTVADIETVGLSHLVLSAATDAPAALLSNCLAMLDRYPSLQAELAENPGKIPGFVEEVLRFDSPGQNLSRQTVAEVEVAGVTIPRDARVMLLLASGNRDERVFDSPDVFDIEREFTQDNKILAFGEGIHSCMGAPIARMAARVLLETMLDGTEYRVVGSPERWIKQMVRGFSYLPMEVVTGPDEKLTGAIDHHASKMTLTPQGTLVETRVVVAAKDLVSEGVVALTLEPADGLPLPEWTAGAHVDLVPDRSVMRQYSLCGDVHDRTKYRLGILREAGGRGGSLFVHDQLAVGEELTVRGPRNNFELEPSPKYLFMAGGIGITPILPMIAAAEAAGAEWQLVYGGRTKASMAFLDELAVHGDKVRLVPQDTDGHLPLAELLGEAKDDTAIYVCGPAPLLDAVEAASAHWPEGALHLERFAAKTMTAPKRPGPFEVELAQTGVTLTVDDDTTVLEAVEEAGVQVLSSCREGTCGTCETPVLEGTPDHRDSVLGERAQKRGDCMMICVSRSCTDKLVLDL